MKMENAEIRDWLFALVDGKLSDDEMVKGFIKYYALNGLVIGNCNWTTEIPEADGGASARPG